MYVDATLKCPDDGEWLAVTRVTSDGETRALGYLSPETLVRVAETLRPLLAQVPEVGHPDGMTPVAWSNFLHWIDVVAELP